MVERITAWWQNHSRSERALLGTLALGIFVVFLWLGIWRPVNDALEAGWARQGVAVDRHDAGGAA